MKHLGRILQLKWGKCMDISNGVTRPVNLFNTSVGNNINLALESENKIYTGNISSSEIPIQKTNKNFSNNYKKKKKNKRLNTIDTDFFKIVLIFFT